MSLLSHPLAIYNNCRSSRLSGVRSGADTPHTAKKKVKMQIFFQLLITDPRQMEKAKEAIERATKAALAEKERKKVSKNNLS